MEEVQALGRAKINLFLRILGRRADGYHEIESVMQTVHLADELVMKRAVSTSVEFDWAQGLSGVIPSPDLVERAIGFFNQNVGGTQGAQVRVTKRIPLGSGLGGGSADAAAALKGMAALSGTVVQDTLLTDFASQLGSDVPFTLLGGTALARGRGEILTRVRSPELWWVLAMPGFEISTARAYEAFDDAGGAPSSNSSEELVAALASGDVAACGRLLSNDLESVAIGMHPELADIKGRLIEAGALGAVVTGSGPTVAGLCESEAEARRIADGLSLALRLEVCRNSVMGAGTFQR